MKFNLNKDLQLQMSCSVLCVCHFVVNSFVLLLFLCNTLKRCCFGYICICGRYYVTQLRIDCWFAVCEFHLSFFVFVSVLYNYVHCMTVIRTTTVFIEDGLGLFARGIQPKLHYCISIAQALPVYS